MPSLVREDRDGPTSGVPVVLPSASPGSYVGTGEPLNASKWETLPKMSPPSAFGQLKGRGRRPRR